MNACVTFGNIFAMDESVTGVSLIHEAERLSCSIDDSCFEVPANYSVYGRLIANDKYVLFFFFSKFEFEFKEWMRLRVGTIGNISPWMRKTNCFSTPSSRVSSTPAPKMIKYIPRLARVFLIIIQRNPMSGVFVLHIDMPSFDLTSSKHS